MIRTLVISLVLLQTFAASPALGDTIELAGTVRLAEGQRVTLADVAEVPASIASLGSIPVEPDESRTGWHAVTAETIRELVSHELGDRASSIVVRGGPCYVRWHKPPTQTASKQAPAETEPVADATRYMAERTVRGDIARRIASILQAKPQDLRLTFDDRDAALLATPGDGRVVEVRPTGRADRLPLAVRVFDGDRVIAEGTTRVNVLVRRTVAVSTSALQRGDKLSTGSLTIEDRWIGPSTDAAQADVIEGQELKRAIDAGHVIAARDIAEPITIRRGDLVTVSVVTPTVVVDIVARATNDAKAGDRITFESQDGSGRRFDARIDERGRAISTVEGNAR
ncbi:MAG: flagellar basal body P-ring formation chaperone FlgA [Planctomycetota bacterium]